MSKEVRNVRNYDDEFKRRAVQLHHKTGKSFSGMAKELGIPAATLAGWIYSKKYYTGTVTEENIAGLHQELKELKQELGIIKEERDILKKALAIFSTGDRKK